MILEEQIPQENVQARRRFHRRKQMKRSKSVDLQQEISNYPPSNAHHHQDYFNDAENLSSSSSSSSSSTADIERINRAALLRYKSLDSLAFNNRKTNGHHHRRNPPKPIEHEFDSDDSVCGIPKPRR